MKKKILLSIILLSLSLFVVSCSKNKTTNQPNKTPASTSQTDYKYTLNSDASVSILVEWNDDSLSKLYLGNNEINSSNYAVYGSLLVLQSSYLDTIEKGKYVLIIECKLTTLSINLEIEYVEKEISINDLIDNSYYTVEFGPNSGQMILPEEAGTNSDLNRYYKLLEANKPLESGESFTVNFDGEDIDSKRLRPYNSFHTTVPYPTPFGDSVGSAFKYVETENGKGVEFKSNGKPAPWDYTYAFFKGSQFLNNASYSITIKYEIVSGSSFTLQFGTGSNIAAMPAGEGVQTATGILNIPSASELYITGDHNWYYNIIKIIMNNKEVSDIIIYSITVERTA